MCNYWNIYILLLSMVPSLTYQRSITSHDVTDLHGDVTALQNDIIDLHSGISRKQRRTNRIQEGARQIRENEDTDRPNMLQSSLNRLLDGNLDMTSPSRDYQSQDNTVDAAATWRGDTPRTHIDFIDDDVITSGSDFGDVMNPVKRYYYRRRCNVSRLSRQAFVEFIKTGKLCGRRVAAIRFALTGR